MSCRKEELVEGKLKRNWKLIGELKETARLPHD